MKKAYFIGIAGKAMAPLAKAFQDQGWIVYGSDHKGVYPPISDYLKENKIKYTEGYDENNVPPDADLVVIGRSAVLVDKQNPEYLKAKSLNIPAFSYPEIIQKYLIKENSIVVAGTFGKTTISSLIAWILIKAGKDPSYMTGGIPVNMKDGVKITESNYSVVEGDEPPSLFEEDLPKFMYYKPKYLLLSATVWDHPEVFKFEGSYMEAFGKLVGLVPKRGGFIVYCRDNVNEKLIVNYSGKKISYSGNDDRADYFVKKVEIKGNLTKIEINGKKSMILETSLIGKHNFENICGAFALCSELGIDSEIIQKAVSTFGGVKTRLELLGDFSGRKIYWDFSQHPVKVGSALQALKLHFPNARIICVFDPAMTGLKYKQSLEWYSYFFSQSDLVIVSKVSFLKSVPKGERVSGSDIVKAIEKSQTRAVYQPVKENIIKILNTESRSGDIIIFMSSGGVEFTKLIEEVKEKLGKLGPLRPLDQDGSEARKLGGIREGGYDILIKMLGPKKVRKNVSMSDYTSFKIGGPADLFYLAETEEELVRVVGEVRGIGVPYFILGNGSNILAGDGGYRGLIIKLSNCELKISENTITAGAGMQISFLLNKCMEESLIGLEFMAGIPGTVGGAVRGNAGAWQQNFGDKIQRVKILSENGEIKWIEQNECLFVYRGSRFKYNNEIILAAEIKMEKGEKKETEGQMKTYLEKRKCQPKEPSAGCIFVNPKPRSTGELIEKCGLKGRQIGGAKISEMHANFIVNTGNAKAADVVALIDLVRNEVRSKFNVELKEEIVRIGEF